MKKFDIKKLLILVLALVMVFALVACNKPASEPEEEEEGGGGNGKTTGTGIYIEPAAYFDALWAASATLGKEPFAEKDSVGLSADLNVKLSIGKEALDLGLSIGAVLDTSNNAKSAAKVKLFDNAKGADEGLTVYYFVDDPQNIYAEAFGQKIRIPFGIKNDDTVSGALNGILTKKILGGNEEKDIDPTMSIVELVNQIKATGGQKDWTIDTVLFPVLEIFGLDLNAPGMVKTILGVLSGVKGDIKSLLPVLRGAGDLLFDQPTRAGKQWTGSCSREEIEGVEGGYHYEADLSDMAGSVIKGLPGMLGLDPATNDVVSKLLANLDLQIKFNAIEKDGKIEGIDGFSLCVESYKCALAGNKDLAVEIGIKDITLKNLGTVEDGEAAEFFGIKKDDYKPEFNLNVTLDLDISDKALVVNYDGLSVDFTGKYQLAVNAKVDLKDGYKSEADLALKYGDTAVLEARFQKQAGENYSELVIKANNDAKIGEYPIVQTLIKLFAPEGINALANAKNDKDGVLQGAAVVLANAAYTGTFADVAAVKAAYDAWKEDAESAFDSSDPNFTGVVIQNIDLASMFFDLVKLPAEARAADETPAEPDEIYVPAVNVLKIIALAVEKLGLTDGISVEVDNILDVITDIFEMNTLDNANGVLKYYKKEKNGDDEKEVAATKDEEGAYTKVVDTRDFEEADSLAMLKITADDLDEGSWKNLFKGSKWADEESDVATATNLIRSAAKVVIKTDKKAIVEATVSGEDYKVEAALTISATAGKYNYLTLATPAGLNRAADGSDDGAQSVTVDDKTQVWAVLSF